MTIRDFLPTQPEPRGEFWWVPCDHCGRRFNANAVVNRQTSDDGVTIDGQGVVLIDKRTGADYLRLCWEHAELAPPQTVQEVNAVPPELEPIRPPAIEPPPWVEPKEWAEAWDVDDIAPETRFCAYRACESQPLEWGDIGEFVPMRPTQRYCSATCRRKAEFERRYGRPYDGSGEEL